MADTSPLANLVRSVDWTTISRDEAWAAAYRGDVDELETRALLEARLAAAKNGVGFERSVGEVERTCDEYRAWWSMVDAAALVRRASPPSRARAGGDIVQIFRESLLDCRPWRHPDIARLTLVLRSIVGNEWFSADGSWIASEADVFVRKWEVSLDRRGGGTRVSTKRSDPPTDEIVAAYGRVWVAVDYLDTVRDSMDAMDPDRNHIVVRSYHAAFAARRKDGCRRRVPPTESEIAYALDRYERDATSFERLHWIDVDSQQNVRKALCENWDWYSSFLRSTRPDDDVHRVSSERASEAKRRASA